MKIGYIIGTYPLVTTTFIDREVQGLRERGMDIAILSIRPAPPEVEQMEEYRAVRQATTYLLPVKWGKFAAAHLYFAVLHALTYWRLFAYLITRPHPGLRHRFKTALHFIEGVYAAYVLRDAGCDRFHAHFADRAATVALCVSRLLGKPYSLTAHANDLYAGPVLLFEKFKNAQFAVTVSQFNKEYILKNHPTLDAERIVVLHPWVNLDEFQPPATRPQNRRFSILSVARLVEKKGHRYLIEACRLLRARGLHIECWIVGGGPLENELRQVINAEGMADCVRLVGPQSKPEVLRRLAAADAFVLASVIAKDGDRDGMPVALAEAMAMQVPVISTNVVGIGELVQDGAGRLVPPQDPDALAHAIQTVYAMDHAARAEMGRRGRAIVAAGFDVDSGIDRLAELFRGLGSVATTIPVRTSFIVWGPPSHGPRSQVLARELGIESLHFVQAGAQRGILSAPFRYIYQAVETLRRLWRERPQVVFVQSPPSLAVLTVYLYCRMAGARYLIDAHSAALLQRVWMSPRWLHRLLLRSAITTMVTNEHFQAQVEADGGHAFLLPDVPSDFGVAANLTPYPSPVGAGSPRPSYAHQATAQGGETPPLQKRGVRQPYIAVVNTFQADEPLDEILAATRDLPEIEFYVTGKKQNARADVLALAPANVHFTDFLADEAYYALLSQADAVMCLTTRDHTMQRGACEALSLAKPIITSDTDVLKTYFDRGTVHVANRSENIRQAILQIRADLACYQREIVELREDRRREFQQKKRALIRLTPYPLNPPPPSPVSHALKGSIPRPPLLLATPLRAWLTGEGGGGRERGVRRRGQHRCQRPVPISSWWVCRGQEPR
ncbi:MAG: glycosyltransferase [Chloroflexi bacterium]|nr:glycosyltransferase [Chloroflexota bacterium]